MKLHESITPKLRRWIEAQHLFFVATAPLAAGGHINLSPRGTPGTFAVLDDHTVAWLDLTGSGAETIAHLRENGRIVVMFCGFDGPPQIVRLHGTGRVLLPTDAEWPELAAHFADKIGARAIIVVDVNRVSDSCGYSVPLFEFVGDRDLLDRWTENRGPAKLAEYRATRNAESIDGLPSLPVGSPGSPGDSCQDARVAFFVDS
ncbi:MAG TPA: pyridoxamine 5'-phosphate oxidase family protein [Mycobacteriales bacterium]|nr:pyridoxamine 5'-phosphate oxidase family protein [Mycobacteriales bacterium]